MNLENFDSNRELDKGGYRNNHSLVIFNIKNDDKDTFIWDKKISIVYIFPFYAKSRKIFIIITN